MSVAPGDCNPTRAVCRFIAQSRAGTGSFCGSVKGRPAVLGGGGVSEAHPPRQTILLNNGLSPLPRGTLSAGQLNNNIRRFIPARAGNTPPNYGYSLVFAVYPRSRGEHWRNTHSATCARGLSPLARGTLGYRADCLINKRFIPARAGNT